MQTQTRMSQMQTLSPTHTRSSSYLEFRAQRLAIDAVLAIRSGIEVQLSEFALSNEVHGWAQQQIERYGGNGSGGSGIVVGRLAVLQTYTHTHTSRVRTKQKTKARKGEEVKGERALTGCL
jgi:hypothetical protein